MLANGTSEQTAFEDDEAARACALLLCVKGEGEMGSLLGDAERGRETTAVAEAGERGPAMLLLLLSSSAGVDTPPAASKPRLTLVKTAILRGRVPRRSRCGCLHSCPC